MILNHPLSPLAAKLAIEKYKDRIVIIENGHYALWWGGKEWVLKKDVSHITFKEALKITKYYKSESNIRYHFISDNSNSELPNISDFAQEDIYSCPTVKFDEPNINRRF